MDIRWQIHFAWPFWCALWPLMALSFGLLLPWFCQSVKCTVSYFRGHLRWLGRCGEKTPGGSCLPAGWVGGLLAGAFLLMALHPPPCATRSAMRVQCECNASAMQVQCERVQCECNASAMRMKCERNAKCNANGMQVQMRAECKCKCECNASAMQVQMRVKCKSNASAMRMQCE